MNILARILCLSIFSPLLILAIHAVVSRLFRKLAPQLAAVLSIGFAQFPLIFLLWWKVLKNVHFSGLESFAAVFYSITVFLSLGYLYFHIFNTSETARRIRILYEIKTSGHLSKENIIALYKIDDIIEMRLKRLVETKQLAFNGKTYRLDQRLLYWAAIFAATWRAILGLNRDEMR